MLCFGDLASVYHWIIWLGVFFFFLLLFVFEYIIDFFPLPYSLVLGFPRGFESILGVIYIDNLVELCVSRKH